MTLISWLVNRGETWSDRGYWIMFPPLRGIMRLGHMHLGQVEWSNGIQNWLLRPFLRSYMTNRTVAPLLNDSFHSGCL